MAYSTFDLEIRIGWAINCLAEKSYEYLLKLEGGKDCEGMEQSLILLHAYTQMLCKYDEDEDYNGLTEEEIDSVVAKIEATCDICFNEKGLTQ